MMVYLAQQAVQALQDGLGGAGGIAIVADEGARPRRPFRWSAQA